jgi:hypothetical protein
MFEIKHEIRSEDGDDEEIWTVTDGDKRFECPYKKDADRLCDFINKFNDKAIHMDVDNIQLVGLSANINHCFLIEKTLDR